MATAISIPKRPRKTIAQPEKEDARNEVRDRAAAERGPVGEIESERKFGRGWVEGDWE